MWIKSVDFFEKYKTDMVQKRPSQIDSDTTYPAGDSPLFVFCEISSPIFSEWLQRKYLLLWQITSAFLCAD